MQSSTLEPGRHRRGATGRIDVTRLVTVVRRGFFAYLRIPGKHRRAAPAQRYARRPVPVHAH